jgi:hypothetical protein
LSDAIAFFDMSLVWIVPSLICLLVIRDAATADPDIATTSAISATAIDPEGVIRRTSGFMPRVWPAPVRAHMRQSGVSMCG